MSKRAEQKQIRQRRQRQKALAEKIANGKQLDKSGFYPGVRFTLENQPRKQK